MDTLVTGELAPGLQLITDHQEQAVEVVVLEGIKQTLLLLLLHKGIQLLLVLVEQLLEVALDL